MGDGVHPCRADVLDITAHADRIDLRRGRQRADHDGNVVAPALGVDHVGEQERAPRTFGNAAQELPAHQRVQFGVLVDGPIDAHQQATRFEIGEMQLEVERRPARLVLPGREVSGLVEHGGPAGMRPETISGAA